MNSAMAHQMAHMAIGATAGKRKPLGKQGTDKRLRKYVLSAMAVETTTAKYGSWPSPNPKLVFAVKTLPSIQDSSTNHGGESLLFVFQHSFMIYSHNCTPGAIRGPQAKFLLSAPLLAVI